MGLDRVDSAVSGERYCNMTFLLTLFTSGIVYLLAYILVTRNYTDGYAALSLAIGLAMYLLIRVLYKSDTNLDRYLARAYRLIIWLVPLALILVKLSIFIGASESAPTLRAFYSFDDLMWTGPFAFVLWPFLNIFTLIENIISLIKMAVYYFGLPIFGFIFVAVTVALISLFKKILRLREESNISFSSTIAVTLVLTPITSYLLIVYFWL